MKLLLVMLLVDVVGCTAELGVCIFNRTLVNNFSMMRAQAIASGVFTDAGVRLNWLSPKQCKNPSVGRLLLVMEAEVPAQFGRGTMGYAQPYAAGTAIHIFYDRIFEDHRMVFADVLGHVIAHEIGHVVEGVARHSNRGIMKASWTVQDYSSMKQRELRFDAQDVELMRLNLQHGVL